MKNPEKFTLPLLSVLILVGCSDPKPTAPDGATFDANPATADGRPPSPDATVSSPDANLSVHAFVTVDGERWDFVDVIAYNGGAQDRTITADRGTDCPLSATCDTLYVSFPRDAQPGHVDCDDLLVSVQLNEGSDRHFSFGSSAAFCGFTIDVNDGETVAISGLSAHLEQANNPLASKTLADGELRGMMP